MQSEPGSASTKVKGIPDNSSIIMPRLVCRDVASEIDFCVRTFGASILNRRPGPGGKDAHALLSIRNEMLMIEAEWLQVPSRAPAMDGSSPVPIFVYVPDVDQAVERGIQLGAKVLVAAQNQFRGDRTAWIMDSNGHVWTIATRIEETTGADRAERWSRILSSQDKS